MRSDELASFVDRVYEASAVPELWPKVLADFAQLADSKDSVLIAARGPGFRRWITSSAAFDEVVEAHQTRFPEGNERTNRLVGKQHAGFVTDLDVFTADEIAVEPVFRDFFRPLGYGGGVATAIFVPSGDTFVLHAERDVQGGPVSRSVVDRLDGLRPHFARAALLSARLEMERVNAAASALELVGLPAAILGPGGRVMAANASLAAMTPDVIQDRRSRVALANPHADVLLASTLASLGGDARAAAVSSIPVRAYEGRPPIVIHLVPVKGAAHDVFAKATVILIATPVVPKDVPTANVVQGLFDLTPAEAKLAALIAAGHTPREASAQLGVAEETARTTLKRVFAKTGTSRQADLVGLLSGTAIDPLA